MKMILTLLFLSNVWLGIVNLENMKHLKNTNEQLMPIAWHLKKWWDFSMSEDDKKEIELILPSNAFNVWKY